MHKMTHTEGHRAALFITMKSGEHDDGAKGIKRTCSSHRERNEKDLQTRGKIFRTLTLNEESEVLNAAYRIRPSMQEHMWGVDVRECVHVCVCTRAREANRREEGMGERMDRSCPFLNTSCFVLFTLKHTHFQ